MKWIFFLFTLCWVSYSSIPSEEPPVPILDAECWYLLAHLSSPAEPFVEVISAVQDFILMHQISRPELLTEKKVEDWAQLIGEPGVAFLKENMRDRRRAPLVFEGKRLDLLMEYTEKVLPKVWAAMVIEGHLESERTQATSQTADSRRLAWKLSVYPPGVVALGWMASNYFDSGVASSLGSSLSLAVMVGGAFLPPLAGWVYHAIRLGKLQEKMLTDANRREEALISGFNPKTFLNLLPCFFDSCQSFFYWYGPIEPGDVAPTVKHFHLGVGNYYHRERRVYEPFLIVVPTFKTS